MDILFSRCLYEILSMIFLSLDPSSLHKARQVCRAWNQFILRELWGRQCHRQLFASRLLQNWRSRGNRPTATTIQLCHIFQDGVGPESFKESAGPTDILVSSSNVLILCRLFDKRVRRLVLLHARNPELSANLVVGGNEPAIMPNGITAVQLCGDHVVVDGGQGLEVVDVMRGKCESIVKSMSHDFLCCSEDKLVILESTERSFNATNLLVWDLKTGQSKRSRLWLPYVDILVCLGSQFQSADPEAGGGYMMVKTIGRRDLTHVVELASARLIHTLDAGSYGVEQDFAYPLIANIRDHAYLEVFNSKTGRSCERFLHDYSDLRHQDAEIGLNNRARFSPDFLIVSRYVKLEHSYANCSAWMDLYWIPDLLSRCMRPTVKCVQETGPLFSSWSCSRTCIAMLRTASAQVELLHFWT